MLTDKTNITFAKNKHNPYVFIVGCPRSGTTLLRRLVSAHPSLAITPETHWIDRFLKKRKGLTPEGMVTQKLVSKLFEYRRFSRLNIAREDLEALITSKEPVSYAAFVTHVFNLFAKGKGKPLVGDKTPEYVRSIALLHSLWPSAKFVHLIRDGRDVCLSAINWRKAGNHARRFPSWSDDPVSTTALWWKWNVQLGCEAGHQIGTDLYYEIRYESLVAAPSQECEALCKFLEVPYDERMLRFHEGQTRTEPGLDAKDAWLPITPGLRDWRTQMRADDIERFEAVAGDLLEALEYPRAVRLPEPKAQKQASLIYDIFTQNACSKGQLLPNGW